MIALVRPQKPFASSLIAIDEYLNVDPNIFVQTLVPFIIPLATNTLSLNKPNNFIAWPTGNSNEPNR